MFANLVLKYRYVLFVLLLLWSGYSALQLSRIEIKQDFSAYFPEGDPERKFYRDMVRQLGDEDDLLALAIIRERGIFDSVFLHNVHQFTRECNDLPQVRQAFSITNLEDIVRTPFGVFPKKFIHLKSAAALRMDSLKISRDPRLTDRLVSKKLNALVVNLHLVPDLSPKEGEQLIGAIERLIEEHSFEATYPAGRKYYEVCYNRTSNRELKKGTVLCLAVLLLILGGIYRSVWGVVLPVLVFLLSMLNFLGYLAMIGRPLDAMSNLFPTIILIVSVSDVIHFFSKYEDKIHLGYPKRKALQYMLVEAGKTTFLTSLTTAIGFLALATSPLPSAGQFGMDLAVGVLFAYWITVVLSAVIMCRARPGGFVAHPAFYNKWNHRVDRLIQFLTNRGNLIIRTALAVVLICLVSIPFINTNHRMKSAVPSNGLRRSVNYFDSELAGARTFEIALIPRPGFQINDLSVLREIKKLHVFLDTLPFIGGIFSPVSYFESLHKSMKGGRLVYLSLPSTQQVLEREQQHFQKYEPGFLSHILSPDRTIGKLSARAPDIGRKNIKEINDSVRSWINSHLDTGLLECRITGASLMIDKVQEHSIRSMFTGLAISLVAISLLMALIFRNATITWITLSANLFPLLVTAACMALFGIELRYGTSIMFTIGFVIAVDDTIHFLSNYRLESLRSKSKPLAVFSALRHTGRAMALTTLLLFGGFTVLIFSTFRDSQAVGLLTCIMLVVAFLADLLLAPWLLLQTGAGLKPLNFQKGNG